MLTLKRGEYISICVCSRSYLLWSLVLGGVGAFAPARLCLLHEAVLLSSSRNFDNSGARVWYLHTAVSAQDATNGSTRGAGRFAYVKCLALSPKSGFEAVSAARETALFPIRPRVAEV